MRSLDPCTLAPYIDPQPPVRRDPMDRMCMELSDDLRTMAGATTRAEVAARRLAEAQHPGCPCLLSVAAGDVTLTGLHLEGAGARQARAVAIAASRFCRGLRVERCSVSSFFGGVLMGAGSEATLSDVSVARCAGPAVELAGTGTLWVDGVTVTKGAGVGVSVQGQGSRLRGRGLVLRQVGEPAGMAWRSLQWTLATRVLRVRRVAGESCVPRGSQNAGGGLLLSGRGVMGDVADVRAVGNGGVGVQVVDGASLQLGTCEAVENALDGLRCVRARNGEPPAPTVSMAQPT